MKIAKGVLALVSGIAVSSVGFAQEAAISGEKTAPMQNILPNSYGKLELRHRVNEKVSDAGKSSVSPQLQIRPSLGSTFFDGKLDTAFTWIFSKKTDNASINKEGVTNETTWTVYENANFRFMPYLYVEKTGAEGFNFDLAQIGPNISTMASVPVAAGNLAFSAYVEPLAEFYSKGAVPNSGLKNDTRKGNNELGLALNNQAPEAGKDVEVTRKDPAFFNTTEVAMKFTPSALPKLSVGVAADLLQAWSPKYRAFDKSDRTVVEADGFKTETMVMNKFTVGYKINDKLTIINQARYSVDGFYAETMNASDNVALGSPARFENRLVLNATLF